MEKYKKPLTCSEQVDYLQILVEWCRVSGISGAEVLK